MDIYIYKEINDLSNGVKGKTPIDFLFCNKICV
jgi:hypothetical protein